MPERDPVKTKSKVNRPPVLGEAALRLLERLCNASAVSGDEGEVRQIVIEQIRSHADQVKTDALGNVLAVKAGKSASKSNASGTRLKVMVAAHMDEVGLMLTYDDEGGLFRFETVGGLNIAHLAGKAVQVGSERVPGVIGAKPVHLTTPEERRQAFSVEALRIDVGPENGRKVKVGDWATFSTAFTRSGPSLFAKALDNRLGVASLIELVITATPNIDLLAAFTVQEEIGLRGARVAAYALAPDLAFVLDCTPAWDLPMLDQGNPNGNTAYNTRLGGGPAIYVADRGTFSDPRLVRHLVETAERMEIPYQIRQPGSGGTDAGAIHLQQAGIPSVSISVPARYPHSPVGMCRLEDWKNTYSLVYAALKGLPPEILMNERG
jgi:putative aminopeptidase FrvX